MLQNIPRGQDLSVISALVLFLAYVYVSVPAPTITLDTPRHRVPAPSTFDIVAIALLRPVYTAAGVGLTTCMRVWEELC
jgi:hypothetical protein